MRRPFDLGERLVSRALVAFGGGMIGVAGVVAILQGRLGDSRAASVLFGVMLLAAALGACWLRSRSTHVVQFACVVMGLAALAWWAVARLPAGTADAPATTANLSLPWALGLAAVGMTVATAGALLADPRPPAGDTGAREAGAGETEARETGACETGAREADTREAGVHETDGLDTEAREPYTPTLPTWAVATPATTHRPAASTESPGSAGSVFPGVGVAGAESGPRSVVGVWARRVVNTVAVVAAVAVTLPVVMVVVPGRVAVVNTSATTTSAPLPAAPGAFELAGKVAFRARFLADSAAGPVVARRHGFAVVDRKDGRVRWRYQRWDRAYPNSPAPSVVSSPDGRTLAALAVRTDAAGGRAGSELQLFDAASGRLTHAWEPADDDAVAAVLALSDRGDVVVGTRAGAEERVTAFDRGGRQVWSVPVDPGCAQRRRAAWTPRTLALDCGDGKLVGLDQGTGKQRWRHTDAGEREYGLIGRPSAATDVVLLTSRGADSGQPGLLAVDTDTGTRRWTADVPGCSATAADARLVVTVACAREDPEPYRYEPASITFDVPGIDVVARDASTGRVRWRRNLYGVHDTPPNPLEPPAVPVTVLPDGRVLLAYLGLVINGFGMACSLRTLSPEDGENAGELQTIPQVGKDYLSRCGGELTGVRGLVVLTATDGTQAAIR